MLYRDFARKPMAFPPSWYGGPPDPPREQDVIDRQIESGERCEVCREYVGDCRCEWPLNPEGDDMKYDDDLTRQDDRDAADDLRLAELERAEYDAYVEGRLEDRLDRDERARDERRAAQEGSDDIWEPNPDDVAPFPRLFTHRGRRGQ